ncbi:MAG: hypothetical protein K8W52_46190, partial [Deltaproteobacteria bacterium]|nr:hypothetical protein [Deltaproteobacteria bacterium]
MTKPSLPRARRLAGAILALALAVPAIAAADPPTVVALDGKDALVDIGGQDGVVAGAELTLLREVVAKDPVSGQTLHDRFAVGTLEVLRVGDHVALARPTADLIGGVLVGDR